MSINSGRFLNLNKFCDNMDALVKFSFSYAEMDAHIWVASDWQGELIQLDLPVCA